MLEGLSVLHNCHLKCIIRKANAVQVWPAVSNTVTEVLKQMTREEAVFFDLCSPPVRLVLYRPLDDPGCCLDTDLDMHAACLQQGRMSFLICIHILK